MKNSDFQEHYFISNDMIHLAYKAENIQDIICSYSQKGYETLSDTFLATFDEVIEHFPKSLPIVLEISGCAFTQEEQELIERTIWNHYHIKLSGIRFENKKMWIRMFWFTISFILSGILLFLVDDNTENILVQYAYLPFWFFGYRILIYLLVDLIPQLKRWHQCEKMAAMNVFFNQNPINEVPLNEVESYSDQFHKNRRDKQSSNIDKMVNYYLIEKDGSACISCTVNGLEDVIRKTSVTGYEMLNTELESYIDQQLPYIPNPDNMKLEFVGYSFTEEEKEVVLRAISSYFSFRTENVRNEYKSSLQRILWFTIFMILATILLFVTEHTVDKASLEFITMIFWFFGDYLIDYVLLGYTEARRNLKRMISISKSKLILH